MDQNESKTELQRGVQGGAQLPQKGPTVMDRVAGGFNKMTEPKITVGIPFGWGLLFALVLLGAIFIGHYLTVAGQSVMRDREVRERGQATTATPFQNQQEFTDALKKLIEQNNKKEQHSTAPSTPKDTAVDTKISEHLATVSDSMASMADKLANNGRSVEQNLKTVRDNLEALTNTLKDDTTKRDIIAKVELAMANKGNVDVTPLATNFQALSTKIDQQVAAKKDIEQMQKDLTGLTAKVQDLSALIRSREPVPGLGEEFAPKK